MSSVEPNVLLELASGFWKGKNSSHGYEHVTTLSSGAKGDQG